MGLRNGKRSCHHGLLVATGSITLRGGADLKADALAAVISGGDLTINGQTQNGQSKPSAFQGLMYSQGDLTLSNTRTVGTVVSASDATGAPGSLTIRDSQVISTPDTASFQLVIKKFETQTAGGLGGHFSLAGDGWEILEPNPADLLVSNDQGDLHFDPSLVEQNLKIRVRKSDKSWRVISALSDITNSDLSNAEQLSLTRAYNCLLYTSPSPRDQRGSRMPSSA